MADIKEQIKLMLENGETEGMIADQLIATLKEAVDETNYSEIQSVKTDQVQVINSFLAQYCPNFNLTLEEEDLEILGEALTTIAPAIEQLVVLVLNRKLVSFEDNSNESEMLEFKKDGDDIGTWL